MARKYTLQQVTGNGPRKTGKASAVLVENGIQIAKITRAANYRDGYGRRYCSSVKFKFYSTQSQARFEDYCDSISKEECVETLGFPFPF